MIKYYLIFLLFGSLSFAQLYERKNIEVIRANDRTLLFNYKGDLSNDTLQFVVKATRSITSPRLVQKISTNESQLKVNYYAGVSLIEVYLQAEDTEDRDTTRHWYDITRVNNGDTSTLFLGWFDIWSNVATRFDGTNLASDGTRFYVAGTFIDSTVADRSVFIWDSTNQRLSSVSKSELANLLDVVTKSTEQTIAGDKNFTGSIDLPETVNTQLVANIIKYGSVGDSLTDNSVAFQNAVNSGKEIFIPEGNFIISNIRLHSNLSIRGAGVKSRLILKDGGTTAFILDSVTNITMSNFSLSGLDESNNYTLGDVIGTRVGIDINYSSNIKLEKMNISGFDKAGIQSKSTVGVYTYNLAVTNSILNNNYNALWLLEKSEYGNYSDLSMTGNYCALKVSGGNNYFTNIQGVNGIIGVHLYKGSNDTHGIISNSSFNHNVYALIADSISYGEYIDNVSFYYGGMKINNATGLSIVNSNINLDSLIVVGVCVGSSINNSTFRDNNLTYSRNYLIDRTKFFNNRFFSIVPDDTNLRKLINDPVDLGDSLFINNTPFAQYNSGYITFGKAGTSGMRFLSPLYGDINILYDNIYDLGSAGAGFKSGYFNTSVNTPLYNIGAIPFASYNSGYILLGGGGGAGIRFDSRIYGLDGQILPLTNNTVDFGGVSFRWKTIYTNQVNVAELLHLSPTTTPSSPAEGDIYFNSSDHHLYVWNGTAWKQLDN